MRWNRRWAFSRSIEVSIAAALLAVGASGATTIRATDRISENQEAAIATLRSIATAQETFKTARDIDSDCDGAGEYGYFAELAGTRPMRIACRNPCQPCAGSPADELSPPLLRRAFGLVRHGCIRHQGYQFQMWLPAPTAANLIWAVEEDFDGGKIGPPYPSSHNGARMWCCYAWPIVYGQTGRHAYFVNQQGVVLDCQNRSPVAFSGTMNPPRFDSAYTVSGDMGSPLRVGLDGPDGTTWWPVP